MKYIIKSTLVYLFFLVVPFISMAQFEGVKEVMFRLDDNMNDDYNVLSLENENILVLNHKTNYYGRNAEVHFMKYDSSLNLLWKSDYSAGENFNFIKYFQGEKSLYCLFKETDKKNIKVLKIDLRRGDGMVTEAKMLTEMEINFFVATENKIAIGGKYNDRPVIELCRLFDQTSKVLPHVHANYVKIISLDVNEATNDIFVMLKDEKKCQFILSVYDYEGKLLEMRVLGEKKKVLISGQIIKLPNNRLVLAGNYGLHCSDYSSGFYILPLESNSKIQYFLFSDLQNFYAYLPEKRQEKIKNRISKRKSKGKDLNIRYRLNLHAPTEINNKINILAEVYYPEFKSTPFLMRNSFQTLQNNVIFNKDFNNYKFTHALICTFDFNGNKEWDYSIGLNNLESTILNQKVQISGLGENYLVAYPKDNFIITGTIGKNMELKEFNSFDLKTLKSDNNIADINVDIMAWFKNTYLAYGEKTLKNDLGLALKEYFYITKLHFQNPKVE